MKKITASTIILILILSLFSSCAHTHTPGPAADCVNPQKCSSCGEILEQAKGHTPAAPDDENRIYCSVCGELLNEAETTAQSTVASTTVEQTAGESTAESTVESTTIITTTEQNTTKDHAPETTTANNTVSDTTKTPTTAATPVSSSINSSNVIADETRASGHYNNNITSYYSGNVLVCGDYGLEYFSLNASGSSEYAAVVNNFAQTYPTLKTSCLIVPKSSTFNAPSGYSDMYENHLAFVNATYSKINDSVKTPDCMSLFNEHRGEYLFYRTDHHWTSLGAYYASEAFCNANGITPRELSSYSTVVNTGYVGSLYGFCASPKPECLRTNPDYTVGHLPAVDYSMTYTSMAGQQKSGPVINTSAQSYAGMFLCGDEPFANITTSAGTGDKLIVFKESYGNGFVPFMIDYFDTILVVDVRHYKGSVASLISQYGITHAVIINNLQAVGSLTSEISRCLAS